MYITASTLPHPASRDTAPGSAWSSSRWGQDNSRPRVHCRPRRLLVCLSRELDEAPGARGIPSAVAGAEQALTLHAVRRNRFIAGIQGFQDGCSLIGAMLRLLMLPPWRDICRPPIRSISRWMTDASRHAGGCNAGSASFIPSLPRTIHPRPIHATGSRGQAARARHALTWGHVATRGCCHMGSGIRPGVCCSDSNCLANAGDGSCGDV
jgi:hypothetical protein